MSDTLTTKPGSAEVHVSFHPAAWVFVEPLRRWHFFPRSIRVSQEHVSGAARDPNARWYTDSVDPDVEGQSSPEITKIRVEMALRFLTRMTAQPSPDAAWVEDVVTRWHADPPAATAEKPRRSRERSR